MQPPDPRPPRSPSGAFNDIAAGFFEAQVVRRSGLPAPLAWVCHLSCALASRAPEETLPALFRNALHGAPPVPLQQLEDWALHCLAYVGEGATRLALRLLAAELDEAGRNRLRASTCETAALDAEALYRRGIALYGQLDAARIPAQIAHYSAVSSDYYAQVMRLFAVAFERPSLTLAQREAATVCLLACAGTEDAQLAFHTRVAMKFGIRQEELAALLGLVQWYAGLPRANNAANVIRAVLADAPP